MWSKCAGIKQKDAKEMSVRHTQAPVPAANGSRLQESSVLNVSRTFYQLRARSKDRKSTKVKSLTLFLLVLAFRHYEVGFHLLVFLAAGHAGAGGQGTLGTAYPTCWHPEAMQWQMALSCMSLVTNTHFRAVSFKRNQHKSHHCSAIRNKLHSNCMAETA